MGGPALPQTSGGGRPAFPGEPGGGLYDRPYGNGLGAIEPRLSAQARLAAVFKIEDAQVPLRAADLQAIAVGVASRVSALDYVTGAVANPGLVIGVAFGVKEGTPANRVGPDLQAVATAASTANYRVVVAPFRYASTDLMLAGEEASAAFGPGLGIDSDRGRLIFLGLGAAVLGGAVWWLFRR